MKLSVTFIFCILLCTSCFLNDDTRKKDSPTTGYLKLYFEEGLITHVKSQIQAFQSTYINANIELVPSNEKECIEALYNDSSKAIIITRTLTEKELTQFKNKNINLQTSIIAKNAIAFIVPINFPDSVISLKQLKDLLAGNDSSYVKGVKLNVMFDNQNSGSTRFLKDSLLPNQNFGQNCSASQNGKELILKISTTQNAIGVCDYAWFSDKDNPETKELTKGVKLLAVSREETKTAYMPDQSNIATNDYPFTRTVCFIKRSSEFSLGKGVQTFIAGPIGQLMILKQGLVPNRQEERLIEVDMTPIGQ